ncbi:MAG TPA: tetratricopeptide repeat protein [Blastocatellia bacterium]|nr:tetratricopeptide repeat protein [Blastocatellia bacterium]
MKTTANFISLLVCASALLWPAITVRAEEFPRGQIIEKVACQADAGQSYALYLPSAYSLDRRWPILYAFDPGARGKAPVELFREAAERYGWVVAGSNNSRNGPAVALDEIIRALWIDTHERFAIDERRVYTTGFSGGARVAISVANALKGQVAGVIACGAGFPGNLTPNKDTTFAFFGIAGIEDFNLIELRRLDQSLEKAGVTHALLTFDGNHAWPPKELCTEASWWMEVQAIRNGPHSNDEKLIAELYDTGTAKARNAEASQKFLDAYLRYQSLADSFKGLRDVTEAASQAQRLKDSKEVKAELKLLREADQQQELRFRQFLTLNESLKSTDQRSTAMADIKGMIANLKKKGDGQTASVERITARRLLTQFFIMSSEQAQQELYLKNYAEAATRLSIAAEIRPDNAQLLYRLASAYAQSGEKKQAVEALRRAAGKGFSDVSRIEQAPEFNSLRNDGEYKKLIEELRRK